MEPRYSFKHHKSYDSINFLTATIYKYFLGDSIIRLTYSFEWTKKTSRKEIPRCWWFCWFEYFVVPNSFYWFRLLNEVRKRTHQMSLLLSVRSCLSDVSTPSTWARCQCSCQDHFWDKFLWKYWYMYMYSFIPNIFTLKIWHPAVNLISDLKHR